VIVEKAFRFQLDFQVSVRYCDFFFNFFQYLRFCIYRLEKFLFIPNGQYIHVLHVKHKVMVVCKLIFLLVPPHTEIVGVTPKIKYQLILTYIHCMYMYTCMYVHSKYIHDIHDIHDIHTYIHTYDSYILHTCTTI
jgi:hypothetical protein